MNSFWKNKKVLLVGGTGFLGKNFLKELINHQIDFDFTSRQKKEIAGKTAIKLDPRQENDFKVLENKYDVLINCAALDGNGTFKKEHGNQVCEDNVRIASNILSFAQKKKIKDLVLFSSAEVYTGLGEKRLSENDLENLKINYNHGYRSAKAVLEILANFYAYQNPELNIYLARPSYVYGPGDRYRGEKNSRLLPLLVNHIKNGKKIMFYGGKTRKINLIYVKDLVNSILKLVEKGKTGPINLTASEVLTIEEIVKNIETGLKKRAKISYQISNLRPGFLLNNQRLLSVQKRFTPFSKGVLSLIK